VAEVEAAAHAARAVFLAGSMRAFLSLASPLAELVSRGDGASAPAADLAVAGGAV
jgi:hypothetical protein